MMSVLLVLYATDEFGLSDVDAGLLYSWWGLLSTLWAGVFCFVIDVTGVKRCAVMGMLIVCCSRAVILSTTSVSVLRLVLLGLSPLAEGLLAPVYMVGIKQLTREEQRALAYGLNYAAHNAGGGFSDVAIDVLRDQYRADPARFQGRLGGMAPTPARVCLLLSELALLIIGHRPAAHLRPSRLAGAPAGRGVPGVQAVLRREGRGGARGPRGRRPLPGVTGASGAGRGAGAAGARGGSAGPRSGLARRLRGRREGPPGAAEEQELAGGGCHQLLPGGD
ncbi:unnamed protein product [Prorocentrum cordatum]|uniref:Solute carrier family 40 protein n=1 Tax=Prorocentrum cordatum TaxID=2364126 RepID=A0ABN9VY81_9DINO|nr:unnamed protein product [Polarella glacialis]